MDLKINAREHGSITILDLAGRIVLGEEAISLREEIRNLLAANHCNILLNFKDVVRVDSSGIGTLVEAVILTAQAGGRLKLLQIPRLLHNSLVIHRLLQAFEIFANEEEALKSFHMEPANA